MARLEALRESAAAPDPAVSAPALYRLGSAYYDKAIRERDNDSVTEEGPHTLEAALCPCLKLAPRFRCARDLRETCACDAGGSGRRLLASRGESLRCQAAVTRRSRLHLIPACVSTQLQPQFTPRRSSSWEVAS